MNANTFRLVFSKRLGMLVPVAEQTISHTKGGASGERVAARRVGGVSFLLKSIAFGIAVAFASPGFSLPTDPTVISGSASFSQVGNVLTVTNSNKAIIDWQKFGIAAGELTRFVQPSVSSSVLNRVLSNNPSLIYGTLSSNGQVWLVNPAGILVGPGGVIDTAGFVGSTLNVRAEDFLAGKLAFQATQGASSFVNQGSITTPAGGSVYLVGPNVSNEGIINAPNGEVILAAGATVNLVDTATPGVKVEVTGADNNATNLGSIVAEAGRIGIVGAIVRNSGTLDASSVVSEGGRIFLKASQDAYVDGNGRIVATGTKGGRVEVLGNRVTVTDNASIDASGTNGGGSILVGGDYQGQNPDVQNATATYFGANATLKANATGNGDGGKVIVWADDTTSAYGTIEAKGGANGGNGGLIETSAKYLDIAGIRVSTYAPRGKLGNWLIDPVEITVDDTYWSSIIVPALASTGITVSASYGGDIFFQQTTPWSTTNSGDLTFTTAGWIGGNWGGSTTTQPTSGLNLTTAGNISFLGGTGVYLGNGSVVSSGAGKTITVQSSGGSVGIGLLEATNVNVTAYYGISDNNWQSTGSAAVNIRASGGVSLISQYGADPMWTCTPGPCIAISSDVAGTPTAISATVLDGTAGGIDIRYSGTTDPGMLVLADYSANPSRNHVEFTSSYGGVNITIAGADLLYSNGGGIYVDTAGSLTVDGALVQGTPSEIAMYAEGDLTLSGGTLIVYPGAYGPFIGLAAGNTVTVAGNLVSGYSTYGGDVAIAAGISRSQIDQLENIDNPQEFFSAMVPTGGTATISGAVNAYGDVGVVAGNVNISGSITSYSPYGGIFVLGTDSIAFTGSLTTPNGGNVGMLAGWNGDAGFLNVTDPATLNPADWVGATGSIYGGGSATTNGGMFAALAGGNIALGDINTSAPSGYGSNGGNVVIMSANGTLAVNSITANGSNVWWDSSEGGKGGTVKLTSYGDMTLTGAIQTSGGDGGEGQKGGNGGDVFLKSTTGAITVNAILADGGTGGDGGYGYYMPPSKGGAGGVGGNISLDAATSITVNGSITANGGSGGQGSRGGYYWYWNGETYIQTGPYISYDGGDGGKGGTIALKAGGTGTAAITVVGDLVAMGGQGGIGGDGGDGGSAFANGANGGNGGNGGKVTLTTGAGSILVSGSINIDGGEGGGGGYGTESEPSIGGNAGKGGDAGAPANGGGVFVEAAGNIDIANIYARGGTGYYGYGYSGGYGYTAGGSGGNGGRGGYASLTAGGNISVGYVAAWGGDGGWGGSGSTSGNGGIGGEGGTVILAADGNVIVSSGIDVSGGWGGDATSGGNYGSAGAGGKGGTIDIQAGYDIALGGSSLYANGGSTGFAGSGNYAPTAAQSGGGGNIILSSVYGGITAGSIYAKGGYESVGAGGAGGNITIALGQYASFVGATYLDVRGGYGSGTQTMGADGLVTVAQEVEMSIGSSVFSGLSVYGGLLLTSPTIIQNGSTTSSGTTTLFTNEFYSYGGTISSTGANIDALMVNMTLNGGSLSAINGEVILNFVSEGSTLNYYGGSSVIASPDTIYLNFLSRTEGGILIEGQPPTDLESQLSGFSPGPGSPGFVIGYFGRKSMLDEVANPSKNIECLSGCTSGTEDFLLLKEEEGTTGGGEGEFGEGGKGKKKSGQCKG